MTLGSVQSDDVIAITDVHDSTQGAQGSTKKLTLVQLFRAETTAITASTPLIDLRQTWNSAGVTFNALLVNVTSTASAAGSTLADFQLAGTSQWNVSKAGAVTQLGALAIGGALTGATTGAFSGAVSTAALTATSIAATGVISTSTVNGVFSSTGATTSPRYAEISNTAGTAIVGVENTTGGGVIVGTTAGDTILRASVGISFSANSGSTLHMRLASTGVLTVASGVAVSAGTLTSPRVIASTDVSLAIAKGVFGDGTTILVSASNADESALTRGLLTSHTNASASGTWIGNLLTITQTAATSGTTFGVRARVYATHTSGTVVQAVGLDGSVVVAGSGGTTTAFIGVQGGGTIESGATVTNYTSLYARAPVNGGTITTAYGLQVDNITAGGTNYAIKTGTGKVSFGDTLVFTPAASRIVPGATTLSLRNTADSADNFIITDAGAATIRATLTTLGGASLHLTSTTLSDYAASAVGTLTNAPTAGPPAKWIRIMDNGTALYIPGWN